MMPFTVKNIIPPIPNFFTKLFHLEFFFSSAGSCILLFSISEIQIITLQR